MSAEGFAVQWLKERFRYDNVARNQEVEQSFLKHFAHQEKLYLVDIGSGIGANCLYFMERLFKNQDWTLIEQDENLYRATFDRIERFLEDYNFFYSKEGNIFRINVWDRRVKITLHCASFFDLEKLVDLEQTDVLLAAAVFDLLTPTQLETILQWRLQNELRLFTTMNYAGMRFVPEDQRDRAVVAAYEQHMQRAQAEGRALGASIGEAIRHFFDKKNISIQQGQSQWKLDQKAKAMHQQLLGFMHESLLDYPANPLDCSAFENWYQQKLKASAAGQVQIEVDHFDFFI